MDWPKTEIDTKEGKQKAIAPQVISASRSTDIPAFYSQWFLKRLEAGYCKWVNPFNRKAQYVSFSNTRAVVFWSKNPTQILRHLPLLDKRGLVYYFQFTLNDYDREEFEPNLPCLSTRLEVFKQLSTMIGKERVIWRFDPLILTDCLTVDDLVRKVKRVGKALHSYTEKLVFSFADIGAYAKVRNNLKRHGIKYREFDTAQMLEAAAKLSDLAQQWGIQLSTCGETINFQDHGIQHNRCIDDALLIKLSGDDPELQRVLRRGTESNRDLFDKLGTASPPRKDPGQRASCGCVVSKDIGRYNTCAHLCLYCYANTSPAAVEKNLEKIKNNDEALCPAK